MMTMMMIIIIIIIIIIITTIINIFCIGLAPMHHIGRNIRGSWAR